MFKRVVKALLGLVVFVAIAFAVFDLYKALTAQPTVRLVHPPEVEIVQLTPIFCGTVSTTGSGSRRVVSRDVRRFRQRVAVYWTPDAEPHYFGVPVDDCPAQ